jgi:hypothetical protein
LSRRKIANLERDLEIAESDYRDQLIAALKRAAAGHYGLFGSSKLTEKADRATAVELLEAGEYIKEIREKLGITDAFQLHERFVAVRRAWSERRAEEPKVAVQFLTDIEAESN